MSDQGASTVRTYGNYINGSWQPAGSGATFESVDPSDGSLIGQFAASDGSDVDAAVAAARAAFPAWRATPAPRRGEILYRFGALLAEHKERVSQAMTSEMGKVIAEARGDVQEGIDIAYLMAGEGRRLFGDTVPSELPDKWAMSVREPLGVAGLITPWNFPIAIPCWKMMPALDRAATPSSSSPPRIRPIAPCCWSRSWPRPASRRRRQPGHRLRSRGGHAPRATSRCRRRGLHRQR